MQIYGRTVQARRERERDKPSPNPFHVSTCRVSVRVRVRVRLQLQASGMNLCYGAITFQQKPRDSQSVSLLAMGSFILIITRPRKERKTLQIKQNVALMGLEIH